MKNRHIKIFATGGTIAGMAGSATRRDYRPGQIQIGDFLDSIAELNLQVELVGEQFANIGSEDIGPELWQRLHVAATAAMDDDACQGVIITHGTDTAEETAFLLDQTLDFLLDSCSAPVRQHSIELVAAADHGIGRVGLEKTIEKLINKLIPAGGAVNSRLLNGCWRRCRGNRCFLPTGGQNILSL